MNGYYMRADGELHAILCDSCAEECMADVGAQGMDLYEYEPIPARDNRQTRHVCAFCLEPILAARQADHA